MPDDTLLRFSLAIAVPMHIETLEARGGPSEAEIEEVRAFSTVLASSGDVLMFGGKKGEARTLFNRLAFGLAVMSFYPGGVKVFGDHYQGCIHGMNTAGEE